VTKHPDLFAALSAPFESNEVKSRTQAGRQLHYITARTAMNRLDAVLGPENWWDDYFPHENSVICRLTIVLPDGKEITKVDAGGYAGMADSGDDDKSGYSDSFKRAAVKFGVGRYLYRDGVPEFSQEQAGDGPVRVPPVSRPEPPYSPPERRDHPARSEGRSGGNGQHGGPPRSGKALFAWTKEQEQIHSVGLLKYLNSWAKLQDFPGRMVDWDAEQVARAHAEAVRKLQSIPASSSDAYEEALSH
jgi:hypothetical protein